MRGWSREDERSYREERRARRREKGPTGENEKERAALISAIRPVHPSPDRIIDRWMGANGATANDAPLCGPLLFSHTFSFTFTYHR